MVFTLAVHYVAPMHRLHRLIIWIGLSLVCAVVSPLTAADPDETVPSPGLRTNPYQVIIDRNAFNLKDAEQEAADKAATNAPPPQSNVKFTGYYKVAGVTKACLALIDATTKPPGNTRYYALSVGELQDGIKVLEIDTTGLNPTVKIEGPMGVAVLNPKDHGFAAAGAPPPAAGVGGAPGGPPKLPGVVAGGGLPNPPAAAIQPGVNPAGGVPTAGIAPGANTDAVIQAYNASQNQRVIPSRAIRTGVETDSATSGLIQYATMKEQESRFRTTGRVPPPPVPPPPPGVGGAP